MQFDYFYQEESENYAFYRTPKVLCTDKRFTILNTNKTILGDELYDAIYDRLLSQIGLKSKFIHDRMREKGWE